MKWYKAKKFKSVKVVVTDFDGVHTDGKVFVHQDGTEAVRCSRRDGLGFEMLRKSGIPYCIVSKETNPVVEARGKKIGARVWSGVESSASKKEIIERIAKEHGVLMGEILYMADDINDSEAMASVGVPIAVADAHPLIKKRAIFVTKSKGGDHAIREVIEMLLTIKKIHVSI